MICHNCSRGVLLKSNLIKICEQFYEYQDQVPQMDFLMGKILYDRENMGRYLDEESLMNKFHWPLFFLDGIENSYKHERKVRFIFHDRDAWGDARDAILLSDATGEARIEAMRQNFINRNRVASSVNGLNVPFDLNNGTLEIIFGSRMNDGKKIF